MRTLLLAVLAAAGCTSFEDPDIVLDLRVLAMTAVPPEQVVDVDREDPPQPEELLAQLEPTEVCALVADPGIDRPLRYQLSLCTFGRGSRCGDVGVVLASGTIEDPDGATPPALCATVEPDGNLLGVLLATLEEDPLSGLGGLDYLVELAVGGVDDDRANDQYAAKAVRVAPRIPVERVANANPMLERLEVSVDGAEPVELPLGRCGVQPAPLTVAPDAVVRISPIESDGTREPYVVPTLDGSTAMFTESLTYQWLATAGGFSRGSTGGTRDIAGNFPELFTEWHAPDAATQVTLWVVQRDERLGARWFEACIIVTP